MSRRRLLGIGLLLPLLGGWGPVAPAPDARGESEALEGPVGTTLRRSVPVLLVPGWFDTGRDLAPLRIRLLSAGWPQGWVASLTFEDATGSNRTHAEEVARAVEALREETGAAEVDIVAHSMGGLATRWYLLERGGDHVRRVVFLGSPHRGTHSAHLSWGGARDEMMPGSEFLISLNEAAPVPEGVEPMTIRTMIDTHIVPGESATLPGVEDHHLCCPTHAGLLHDDEVFSLVRDFLTAERVPDAGESVGAD